MDVTRVIFNHSRKPCRKGSSNISIAGKDFSEAANPESEPAAEDWEGFFNGTSSAGTEITCRGLMVNGSEISKGRIGWISPNFSQS